MQIVGQIRTKPGFFGVFSGSGPQLNTLYLSLRELNGAGKTDQEKANPAQICWICENCRLRNLLENL